MAELSTLRVPDIGDFDEVDVVEVLIEAGQTIAVDDSLITLESDKASLDVPAEVAGTVVEVLVQVGDKVGEGTAICTIEPRAEAKPSGAPVETDIPSARGGPPWPPILETESEIESEWSGRSDGSDLSASAPAEPRIDPTTPLPYASPAVRRLARELGADLTAVTGSGPRGRITADDLKAHVKRALTTPSAGPDGIPPIPVVDFAVFGEIETRPLSKIKRLTAQAMTRSWLNVPHVTQHDEADITELEHFRKAQQARAAERGVKLSVLPFVIQAVAVTLKVFPEFNASLDPSGEQLILKRYVHIGIAVDTPSGLVVPVVRDADRKGLLELSEELAELSGRAREGKSKLDDFQGGSFTISSLGGIGGTAFTPIVNAPEVAILGVSRHTQRPVFRDGSFVPRLMLPLSLSYDHRVVDGAAAARFTTHLGRLLADIRQLLL